MPPHISLWEYCPNGVVVTTHRVKEAFRKAYPKWKAYQTYVRYRDEDYEYAFIAEYDTVTEAVLGHLDVWERVLADGTAVGVYHD